MHHTRCWRHSRKGVSAKWWCALQGLPSLVRPGCVSPKSSACCGWRALRSHKVTRVPRSVKVSHSYWSIRSRTGARRRRTCSRSSRRPSSKILLIQQQQRTTLTGK
eukprot:Mycagemm_TRINITY_DN8364_c0_g1::TRINITY_DN8364_c0_g1_i2::g.5532::m.5532 type:complete len:106 gc:universal TRINITY_DN8364_c0_g1_i2:1311-1628(+)